MDARIADGIDFFFWLDLSFFGDPFSGKRRVGPKKMR